MTNEPLKIVGMPGSPYSRKLRAVLRYRRIPYAWIHQGSPEARELPVPRVVLLPQLIEPDAQGTLIARTDSTPLIRELETRFSGRSVIPSDPVLRVLDEIIEDYADEWLTKAMFHYRWAFAPDIANAAAILPRWARTDLPNDQAAMFGEIFSKRQIDRLSVVGSNAGTVPVIEASYARLLKILDTRLCESRFVCGKRPGAGDFALYGQLTQLAGFDPTPRDLALRLAPRVIAWVDVVDDPSGLEPQDADWLNAEERDAAIRPLLEEIGRTYVPFLLANAAALERGESEVVCRIDGAEWRQQAFPYQRKCLAWMRESRGGLDTAHRDALDRALAGTGCEALFA